MKVSLVSEQELPAEMTGILSEVFRLHGWTSQDELYYVRDRSLLEGKVLALGAVPDIKADIETVSPKELLNTPGGKTKLSWAVYNLLNPRKYRPFIWSVRGEVTSVDVPKGLIALDIEVSGDIRKDEPEDTELLSVALAWKRHRDETVEGVVYSKADLARPEYLDELRAIVTSRSLLTHNGKFDLRWINALLGVFVLPTHDTQLLHHALFPGAKEHGLKPISRRILNAPDWEEGVKQYLKGSKAHYERIPQDVLVVYNAWDVYWTWLLLEELLPLANEDELAVYRHALDAGEMFQPAEAKGMKIDLVYSQKVDAHLEEAIQKLRDSLSRYVGNPNSVPQVLEAAKRLGVPLGSTGADVLRKAVKKYPENEEFAEFVSEMLNVRGVTKARSTYVTSVLEKVRGGRVHPTFLIHGTTTGRTSSSGPNVQNVTNDGVGDMSVRRMYVAAPGYRLVGCDYSQAELRTMAELSDDEKMIADLQEGSPDFFNNMMPSIFTDVDFDKLDSTARHPYRLKNKRVVYGTSYGLTDVSIAEMLTLDGHHTSPQEAAMMQSNYLDFYPDLKAWREDIMDRVLDGDHLITPFGRRFQMDIVLSGRAARSRVNNQALAFMPQSTASDICVRAAVMLWRHFQANRRYRDCHIVALVHDAIYTEVPTPLAEEVLHLTQDKMRGSGAMTFHRVPFLTDGKIGRTWDRV